MKIDTDSTESSPMKLSFRKPNGPIDDLIGELLEKSGVNGGREYVREMILAALKAGQENIEPADLKMMKATLKEMRFTAKVFGPYRNVRKVSVFGSARTRPEDTAYQTAVELGRTLKENGYMVITGGGPGIMQAVNEGAGVDHSFGINIRLPFEQRSNPIVDGQPRSIVYKYFFNRKVAFVKEAHGVVLFPGGFGTLDEAMEILTLVQTGKRDPIPLILVDPPGSNYWQRWLTFIKAELMDHGYIGPDDFSLFERVESIQAVINRLDRFYRRYHSLRYVNDLLVIRMRSALTEAQVDALKSEFSGILTSGGNIRAIGYMPEEANEPPEIRALPRLLIDFNRKNLGLLRKLIDKINDMD